MENAIAIIQRSIDRFKRLEINDQFLLCSAISFKNITTKQDKTIRRRFIIQFKPYFEKNRELLKRLLKNSLKIHYNMKNL